MEQEFLELINKAQTDRVRLVKLKNFFASIGAYSMASKLRDLEQEKFPDTPEMADIRKQAELIRNALKLVDLGVSEKTSWLIMKTVQLALEKQGEFSVKDAAELQVKCSELYPE